jgi:hypothetical protein
VSAQETQRLDPAHADVAELEVAIIRGKRDRELGIARAALHIKWLLPGGNDWHALI